MNDHAVICDHPLGDRPRLPNQITQEQRYLAKWTRVGTCIAVVVDAPVNAVQLRPLFQQSTRKGMHCTSVMCPKCQIDGVLIGLDWTRILRKP